MAMADDRSWLPPPLQVPVMPQLGLTSRPPATFLLAVCTPRATLDLRNRKMDCFASPCRHMTSQAWHAKQSSLELQP